MPRKSKEEEAARLFELTAHEREIWSRGFIAAGADEVGRGPLAGPVVAACVILPDEPLIEYVNDSKELTEKRREALSRAIAQHATACGLGWVDEKTIDEINILNATRRAFEKAFQEASETKKPDVLLVDAVKGLNIDVRQEILVHGDTLSYLIAAASIVAKTARDEYMMKMDELYPEYGFKRNKGYGTAEHIQAIKRFGPCAIHRKTFITKFV